MPEQSIVVVTDSFEALELHETVRHKLCIVTRLHRRLDAALYDPAPPRPPNARVLPLRKDTRQPR